jgi:hypothetical protein
MRKTSQANPEIKASRDRSNGAGSTRPKTSIPKINLPQATFDQD